jgi:multicomponent Na+:H+ antiporter subunit G
MKEIIVLVLILLGSIFILIAAIGLLRFRDVFSRMHATTKATSFGLLLILTGVALHFLSLVVFIKAYLVILFIYLTAPLAAHSISRTIRKPDREP